MFKWLQVDYSQKGTTAKYLGEIARTLNISPNGNKRAVFNRIRDYPGGAVEKISEDVFKYHRDILPEAGLRALEQWIILTPEEVPPVPGVNMGTGAQEGYFGTTNKENAAGSKRSNFLINEKIVRPEFEPKKKKTRRGNTATDVAVAAEDEPVRKDGHPSDHCRQLLPKLILA